jgi:hypothetical protein
VVARRCWRPRRSTGSFFHAGVDSAEDPRHTVEPQRERLARPTSS